MKNLKKKKLVKTNLQQRGQFIYTVQIQLDSSSLSENYLRPFQMWIFVKWFIKRKILSSVSTYFQRVFFKKIEL